MLSSADGSPGLEVGCSRPVLVPGLWAEQLPGLGVSVLSPSCTGAVLQFLSSWASCVL